MPDASNICALRRPQSIEVVAPGLLRNGKGQIRACECNALELLAAEPRYDGLHWDDFLNRLRIDGRDWTDHDDRSAQIWLQSAHDVPGFTLGQVRNAALALAFQRRRDSLRDYIDRLPAWDGIGRIHLVFVEALGAADTELNRAASRNFFIALVARGLQPGAQVDTLFTFEGPQGAGKSRAMRALGGPFHAEITAPIGTPDFMRELRGVWIAELGELDSLRGKEASTVKRLLSAPWDRFVEKFEKHASAYPRRAVTVATTNEASYWQDPTGARRLVPVRTGDIALSLIEAMREQWFAEARAAFLDGACWWEFPTAIREAQEDRQQVDPWEDTLRRLMAEGRRVADVSGSGYIVEPWPEGWLSSAAIMRDWLKLEPHQQGQTASTRLRNVMRRLGYRPERSRGRPQQRGWVVDATEGQGGEVATEASTFPPL